MKLEISSNGNDEEHSGEDIEASRRLLLLEKDKCLQRHEKYLCRNLII